MKKIIVSSILFFCFINFYSANAQDLTKFDFQVLTLEDGTYNVNLQLFDAKDVQFIEIHLMLKDNLLSMETASLNKDKKGKYYMYYKNEENEVSLDNLILPVTNEFGVLDSPSILIKLVDKDFNIIDSFKKLIN